MSNEINSETFATMTPLELADYFARMGIKVFPCRAFIKETLQCICGIETCSQAGYHLESYNTRDATTGRYKIRDLFMRKPDYDVGLIAEGRIFATNPMKRQSDLEELLTAKDMATKDGRNISVMALMVNKDLRPPFTPAELDSYLKPTEAL